MMDVLTTKAAVHGGIVSTTAQPSLPDNNFNITLLFFVILSSLGMLGNALVCVVMLRYRKAFHSATNKLIIHQSIIDLIGSTVFLVRRFALVTPPVPDNFLGRLYCRVWWSEWPQFGMFVVSTYNLVAISTERYFATCHPVKHRNMFSPFRLKLVMLTVWIAGFFPEAHLVPICYYNRETLDCDVSWSSMEVQVFGGIFVFVTEIIIPITIMVLNYSRIIWTLRQRSRARDADNNTAAREIFSKANRNVTITLVVVAIFFVICWLPLEITYLLTNLNLLWESNLYGLPVYQVVSAIVVINLCINPFIYCFTYDRFRKKLREMFRRNRARVDVTSTMWRTVTSICGQTWDMILANLINLPRWTSPSPSPSQE